MPENKRRFLEQVSGNEELAKRLAGASREDIIAIAKSVGIELTGADFIEKNELSDDEPEVDGTVRASSAEREMEK